jgi:transposase
VAGELILSFVPDAEQRAWRTMTGSKQQRVRDRVRLQNQMEALLEETRIKRSSVVSDLLGASGRRIREALAGGETDPVKLAEWGDDRLKCSREELIDALRGRPEPMHVEILKLYLERLKLLDRQIESLDRMAAQALKKHEEAVIRLAQVPGLGADSAQQIIAEVGVDVKAFPSATQFASWAGTIPGSEESAEKEPQFAVPEGQQVPAADSDPGSAGSGQKKELPLPECVPQTHAPLGLQRRTLGHRPQALPPGLEDSARPGPLH